MASNAEGGTASQDYLKYMAEGSGNVDEWGNFSIQVLSAAVGGRFDMKLVSAASEEVRKHHKQLKQWEGFIGN